MIVIGEGLSDVSTGGYTLVTPPKPAQYLVHAHPSPAELGRVFRADLPILTTPGAFARALARLKPPRQEALEPLAARPARRLRALVEARADRRAPCASRK